MATLTCIVNCMGTRIRVSDTPQRALRTICNLLNLERKSASQSQRRPLPGVVQYFRKQGATA